MARTNDTYNPKIELDISVEKALDSLNKIVSQVSEIQKSLTLDVKFKADKQALESVLRDANKLQQTFKAGKFDRNMKVNSGVLRDELDRLIEQLRTTMYSLNENIKNAGAGITGLGKTIEAQITKVIGTIDTLGQHITRLHTGNLDELGDDMNEAADGADRLSGSISRLNPTSLSQLVQTSKQLKTEFQAFADLQLDWNTQVAERKLQSLYATLLRIDEKLKQMQTNSLNIKVTNDGFDRMVGNINRITASLDRTMRLITKHIDDALGKQRNFTSEVRKTEHAYKTVERYAARTAAKIFLNKKFGTGGGGGGGLGRGSVPVHFGDFGTKLFFAIRGLSTVFQQVQNLAYQIGQQIQSIAQSVIGQIAPAVKEMMATGFEIANTMETTRIGYQLFFPNEDTQAIQRNIQQRAIANPVFDTADLSKYVSQLAPLSANSELAMDAIEGIATILAASGQEVSTYMQRLVTNTQQVVSTGKATARDWNEFLRAAPVFETALKEVAPEVARKVKDGNGEITKSDTKYLLQALAAVRNSGSLSNVLDIYGRTFSGRKQQMEEATQATTSDIIQQTGLYDLVKRWLGRSEEVVEMLNRYFAPAIYELTFQLSKIKVDQVRLFAHNVYKLLRDTVKNVLQMFGINIDALTSETMFKAIEKGIKFMLDYFEGYAKGIKNLVDIVGKFTKIAGLDASSAYTLGMLASPFGNMWSHVGQMLEGASQFFANLFGQHGLVTSLRKAVASTTFKTQFLNTVIPKMLSKSITSLIILAVGKALSEASYNLLKDGLGVKGAAGISGAITGLSLAATGAMMGSIFGPAGAIAGGAIGTLIGITTGIREYNRRIEENTRKQLENDVETKNKLVNENIQNSAKSFVADFNALMKEQGRKDLMIDTGSNAGFYALRRLEKYMEENDVSTWDKGDMAYLLNEANQYKLASERIAAFASKQMQDIETGRAFDVTKDIALRDQVAKVIRGARLLKDIDYSSYSSQELVTEWLDGNKYTVDQLQALVQKYEDEKKTTGTINDTINDMKKNQDDFYTKFTTFDSDMSALVDTMNYEYELLSSFYDSYLGQIHTVDSSGDAAKVALHKLSLYNPQAVDPFMLKNTGSAEQAHIYGLMNKVRAGDKTVIEDLQNMFPDQKLTNEKDVLAYLKELLKATQSIDESEEEIAQNSDPRKPWTDQFGVVPAYKASGGFARGVDTVPAMLQRGEFVVRRSVVDKVGASAMHALNRGDTRLAATMMGRPNVTTHNGGNTWNRTTNSSRKAIRQNITIVNRNHADTINSGFSLANRLATV